MWCLSPARLIPSIEPVGYPSHLLLGLTLKNLEITKIVAWKVLFSKYDIDLDDFGPILPTLRVFH